MSPRTSFWETLLVLSSQLDQWYGPHNRPRFCRYCPLSWTRVCAATLPSAGKGGASHNRGSCLRVEGRLNLSYPEFDNSEKLGNASIAPSLAPTSLGTYGSPSVAHASISQPSGQESYSTIACAKLFRLACGTRGLPHHQTE